MQDLPMYDADDIVDQKNREKRKRRMIKLIAAVVLITVVSVLMITKDQWLPKLRGIGKQYKTIVNSGQLAEGNFPIEVSGGEDYQLRYTVRKIMVLSDMNLNIYDTDGNLLKKRQHAYINPVLRVANGRALVYENGGNRFSMEDEDEVFYTKSFENNILFARLSSDGYTAVVTTSENFSCELTVYNKKGSVVYERKCTDMISDVSFINKSAGCVVSYIKAENGYLSTIVQEIDFTQSEEKSNSLPMETLGLEIFGSDEGAFVYGMNACGYVNKGGEISSFYRYDGECAAGASMSGRSAVVINDDDARKYKAVLFADNNDEPVIIELDSIAVDVSVFGGLAYILCSDKLLAYEFDGTLRSTAEVTDAYTGFVRSDDHIFLKGYNRIDRIDYAT